MTRKLRIGVLISGSGSNLQANIDACRSGRINGDVEFVGSDTPGVFGLERAQNAGIPTFVVDYKKRGREIAPMADLMKIELAPQGILGLYEKSAHIIPSSIIDAQKRFSWFYKRITIENELLEEIEKYEFDLLVLAGFMHTLTALFIDQINVDPAKPRIMNIHPALLPAFPGTNGYEDTYNYGCKVGGCTVHFVDYGEDTGPIIGQRSLEILPHETLDAFKDRGLKQEWELYPRCIQLYAEDRLRVVEGVNGRKIVQIID